VGAGLFGAIAPAANADHFVERVPGTEGVIGRVHDDYAAAVFDVLFEGVFEGLGPAVIGSVVIPDDDLIFAPLGLESGEVGSGGRGGDDVDLEKAGFVEFFLEDGGSELPGVIGTAAFAIEEHDFNGAGSLGGGGREREQGRAEEKCEKRCFHVAKPLGETGTVVNGSQAHGRETEAGTPTGTTREAYQRKVGYARIWENLSRG